MTDRTDSKPSPEVIRDGAALERLAARLRDQSRIALDTEAASFHRYVDRVYLIQASSASETALVDPLAVDDLRAIGDLLSDPEIEKIFHDADYDLRILDRDYGFTARRLWDTRIAAQLAGETAFGLGALLAKYFDLRLSKKLQRADWSQRPLTPEMIAYAANDTAHLPELRDVLADALRKLGRLAWAEEEFERLEGVHWSPGAAGEDAYLKLKGAKALAPRSLAVLRALFAWRDRLAAELDRAPFRIMGNDALMAIAKAVPTSPTELAEVRDLPSALARRHGPQVLAAVGEALALPRSEWPVIERTRRPKPDPEADARYQRLRTLRAERAQAVRLDPGLVCPNGTLHAIARTAPRAAAELDQIGELRRWQREAMDEGKLLAAVRGDG
ncbi:MAG TPA: ribonuclease D [Gemmatimonadales bacterium]|nr:ribonuclease D [Gemmatimonadales bacterium]